MSAAALKPIRPAGGKSLQPVRFAARECLEPSSDSLKPLRPSTDSSLRPVRPGLTKELVATEPATEPPAELEKPVSPKSDMSSMNGDVLLNHDSSVESLKPGKSSSPKPEKSALKELALEELKASTSSMNVSLKERSLTTSKFVADSQFLNTMRLDYRKEYSKLPEHGIFPLIVSKDLEPLKRVGSSRGLWVGVAF
jgi:hypothetical protein